MERVLQERFAGIERLYGRGSVARLAQVHVCVVGVGGVGSWAVEALARTAVGRITMIDADDLCLSNTSRQLPALDGFYGRAKVDAMAERARAINPLIAIDALQQFVTLGNLEELLTRGYDHVIDACDSLRVKVEMIAFCRRRKIPLVTCGAAGGRTDPTKVQVRDLSRTEHDAMLALVRKRLRAQHGFPRNPDRYFGVQAVYSLENVQYPQADGSVCGVRPKLDPDAALKLDCGQGLGSVTQVTGTFAFAAVSRVVAKILA
jgi:tRNA threonylcarbamoyladenosine dehydratase